MRGERPYCCDVCSKTFKVKSDLVRHEHLHSDECPYCCDVCRKAFTRNGSLIIHKRLHIGECSYCCDVCSKTFNLKINFLTHKPIHSGELPYSWGVCNVIHFTDAHDNTAHVLASSHIAVISVIRHLFSRLVM